MSTSILSAPAPAPAPPAAALEAIAGAVRAEPGDGNLRMVLGEILLALGRREEALAALTLAMALGTDVEILNLVAEVALPGPRYHEHLAALHRLLKPATYLEIGVFKGDALALARPGTRAVGVDPSPLPEAARKYAAPTSIHRMTSDAYFAALAGSDAAADSLDFAFIDGLHLYEQVLRDFINVEQYCHPGSIVVLHDTLPVALAATARERRTRYWCGDVWKMLPCLRKYRPELALLTIPTHPSGLTLVAGLDRASRILAENFDRAVADFIAADVPATALATGSAGDVANSLEAVRDWLAARPSGNG